jgi:DNA-binding winged helix-turn-helix (wHTH) protein
MVEMQKFQHKTLSFDGFILDLTRGRLLRGIEELKLRPKSFEVLKPLVENSNRLASKAELMHAVWPDSFVTDDSLVQCLIEIRRAPGDDPRRYISYSYERLRHDPRYTDLVLRMRLEPDVPN